MSRQYNDSSFNDRKLKPIYDHLDNGCYKKSLQEIDKLLRKNKDWLYLKVLKALTFIRMNRRKEGTDILTEVSKDTPIDESTLQMMTICYRDLHQNDMIPSIYENALKRDPTSEKLFTNLFMAYVRIRDYKKQQLCALNLYKAHQKNPYYFWAIHSIYMQAITTDDDRITAKITLPLAEKMCERFYNENKFEAEQEINLYLMILEKQKKYSTMLQLFDSPIGKKKLNDYLGFGLYRRVQIMQKEGLLADAFAGLIQLIKANCDQLNYYLKLFPLACELDESKSETDGAGYLSQFLDLVEEMCNSNNLESNVGDASEKRKPRGPFLAKIIICSRIQQSAKPFSGIAEKIDYLQRDDLIIDLIIDYFERFGHKFVCIKDITFVLSEIKLSREQIEKLLLKIKLSLLCLDDEKCIDEVNKSLCFHYIAHYIAELSEISANDRLRSELTALSRLAKRTIDFAREKLETQTNDIDIVFNNNKLSKQQQASAQQQQQQPFDPIVYLMANKMAAGIDIYKRNDQDGDKDCSEASAAATTQTVFDLIALLECALTNRKDDFYCKLLLVRLYNSIGAAASSHELYETLDIKLIQNDTLGHYFLSDFLSCGLFAYAQQFLNVSWKFYTGNSKETNDFIITFYKNGTFAKIEEIVAFNSKIRNSIQYHVTFVERLYLNLLLDCKNHLSLCNLTQDFAQQIAKGSFDVAWDDAVDNRDLKLLNCNQKHLQEHICDVLREKTFADELRWTRYRFTLLRALTIASHLSETLLFANLDKSGGGGEDGDESTNPLLDHEKLSLDSFAHLIEQLNELIDASMESVEKSAIRYCLEGPAPSRIETYFRQDQQSKCVFALLNCLLNLFTYCVGSDRREEAARSLATIDLSAIFANFTRQIDALFRDDRTSSLPDRHFGSILRKLTHWTESLSICISLLDVALCTIQKFQKSIKRSRKKKLPENVQFKDCEQVLGGLGGQLSSFHANIEDALKNLLSLAEKLSGNISATVSAIKLTDFIAEFQNDNSAIDATIRMKLKSSYERSISELTAILQIKQKYLATLAASPQTH